MIMLFASDRLLQAALLARQNGNPAGHRIDRFSLPVRYPTQPGIWEENKMCRYAHVGQLRLFLFQFERFKRRFVSSPLTGSFCFSSSGRAAA